MISVDRFNSISNAFKGKKILIIGDLMLDRYYFGQSNRMSPEAPVPVVDVEEIRDNPGGASNVALNLSSLGALPILCGVVGEDSNGEKLLSSLNKHKISADTLIYDKSRPTTVKSRIISKDHQILRMDFEHTNDISSEISSKVVDCITDSISDIDGVILQDSNKGLLNNQNIEKIISIAGNNQIPVYVDPKHKNFSSYRNVKLFKPNQSEFYSYMSNELDLETAGFLLANQIECDVLMITRSSDGISLFYDSKHHHIPTKARTIHDVSGAGDTVISVYSLCEISGANPLESASIANFAAGRVCELVGVTPITMAQLQDFTT